MAKKGFKAQNPNIKMAERGNEQLKDNAIKVAVEESTTTKQIRRKVGRPRKSEAEKKKQYTITLDPKLYKQIKATAEETFKSTSQLITDACVEYLKNNG